ncbi:MAG: 23S rRNA (uracil(1939)-C(5))-methyltransferase RlmD [Simkaniaceae bacterium]|nr:23S rRNA (uracil(1939)-C(5))-methyltransferase RlmD [Simkaniaceae bacterium]
MLCQIEKYSKKGHGVAEDREIVGTVVGDEVEIELLRRKKAQLLEVLKPSSSRCEPRCSHAIECGGCVWQQVKYEAQLQEKQQRIEKLFGFCEPIIACDEPWAYRNKMEFSFSQDKAGNKYLGLMQKHGRGRVLNLQECHLVRPWMSELLIAARKWWEENEVSAFHPPRGEGSLRTLTMREGMHTGEKMVILTINGRSGDVLKRSQIDSFMETVLSVVPEASFFVFFHKAQKGVETEIYEMHLAGLEFLHDTLTVKGTTHKYAYSPSAFFQPNPTQAQRLYEKAFEMVGLEKSDTVFDLYCGIGSIGMSAAPFVDQVIGIEINPYSVWDAKANIENNDVQNMVVFRGDVPELLKREELSAYEPDVVIVDPPRSGLDPKTMAILREWSAKKILYISCNPKTQAEDVAILTQGGRFTVQGVCPVDQFPHTPHIENIVVLKSQ